MQNSGCSGSCSKMKSSCNRPIVITNTHLAESFAQQIKGLPVLSQALTASLDGFVSLTFESSQF